MKCRMILIQLLFLWIRNVGFNSNCILIEYDLAGILKLKLCHCAILFTQSYDHPSRPSPWICDMLYVGGGGGGVLLAPLPLFFLIFNNF